MTAAIILLAASAGAEDAGHLQIRRQAQKAYTNGNWQDAFDLYRQLGYGRGDFPVAEQIGDQTFTLPLFPAMTTDDVDRVVAVFNELLA